MIERQGVGEAYERQQCWYVGQEEYEADGDREFMSDAKVNDAAIQSWSIEHSVLVQFI